MTFQPIRSLQKTASLGPNDVLVVFGEVFSRGYVNGLIDQAKNAGAHIIYSTVGRRDNENQLRPLTQEELAEKDQPLINVPLEAGFDLEQPSEGLSPVDQLKGIKMSQWKEIQLDWPAIEQSRRQGEKRFRKNTQEFLAKLKPMLPENANVLFVHTMAGGFPRAKVVMPVANRVFKGYDERYSSSKEFWESELGRLCDQSFLEVTGETFRHLIELSQDIRETKTQKGLQVSYLAFGYHGTEVLVDDNYRWQAYSPYLQGWAKLRLEEIAKKQNENGLNVGVFNAPEILTNSSSIFLGVEVSLYPLLESLKREAGDIEHVRNLLKTCEGLLLPDYNLEKVFDYTNSYFNSEIMKKWNHFENWPVHNGPEQMELMRTSSTRLIEMHKDPKNLITQKLSETVFKSCGKIMFNQGLQPSHPVQWMGHDIVAKSYGEMTPQEIIN